MGTEKARPGAGRAFSCSPCSRARPVGQRAVSYAFGPTRRGLAAHVVPLSTGAVTTPCPPTVRSVRIRPADPHPLDLAERATPARTAASWRRERVDIDRLPCSGPEDG